MAYEQSAATEAPAEKTETQRAEVCCPSCGHHNVLDSRATVALPKANAFPAECVVLAVVECGRCGYASFFNPSVIRRALSSKQLTVATNENDSTQN